MITDSAAIGQTYSGAPKAISMPRVWAFSGGPFAIDGWPRRNIHTDPAAANRDGLDGIAISGTQFEGYVAQLMVEIFGESWLSHGKMHVRLRKPVPDGDVLQAFATVRTKESGGAQSVFYLDVECRDSAGEQVLTGTAEGQLARETAR